MLAMARMSRLDRIADWEERARQSRFRVRALARNAGVSAECLRLHVRSRFEATTTNWLGELRMREARHLLAQGQLVKEIAHALGFTNSTHFSRAFRAAHGASPRNFAARLPLQSPYLPSKGSRD